MVLEIGNPNQYRRMRIDGVSVAEYAGSVSIDVFANSSPPTRRRLHVPRDAKRNIADCYFGAIDNEKLCRVVLAVLTLCVVLCWRTA
jgi:hypothetical protein